MHKGYRLSVMIDPNDIRPYLTVREKGSVSGRPVSQLPEGRGPMVSQISLFRLIRSHSLKAPVHRPGYRHHDRGVSGGIYFGNGLEQGDK